MFSPQIVFDSAATQVRARFAAKTSLRSEEHTSELQSLRHLVCRLLLEEKKPNGHRGESAGLAEDRKLGTEAAPSRECTAHRWRMSRHLELTRRSDYLHVTLCALPSQPP